MGLMLFCRVTGTGPAHSPRLQAARTQYWLARSGRVTPRRPDLFRRPFIIVKLPFIMHVLLPQTSDGSWRLYLEGRKACDGHYDPRSGSEASDGYGRLLSFDFNTAGAGRSLVIMGIGA